MVNGSRPSSWLPALLVVLASSVLLLCRPMYVCANAKEALLVVLVVLYYYYYVGLCMYVCVNAKEEK